MAYMRVEACMRTFRPRMVGGRANGIEWGGGVVNLCLGKFEFILLAPLPGCRACLCLAFSFLWRN